MAEQLGDTSGVIDLREFLTAGVWYMPKPIVYLYRGKTTWLVSLRGMPEDDDLAPLGPPIP